MFGVLKGAACAMEANQRQQWTGHICGVCLALKDRHGLLSRIATNYDAALLSVMYDAQTPQPQTRRPSYCPFRNSFKAEILDADNPGVEYAASMALMMASSKIRDNLQDNGSRLRLARGVAMGVSDRWMRAAQETSARLGLDAGIVEDQIRRQPIVEAQPNRDFSFYARPTELAVGTAFRHTAILATRYHNADILHELGRMFGRIMYLLDSYQDYAADLAAQRFNALAAAFPEEDWEKQASRIFRKAYAALRKYFYQLGLSHPALPSALLIRQLRRRGYRTLQICDGISPSCRPLAAKTTVARSTYRFNSDQQPDKDEQEHQQEEQADELEDEAREQISRDLGCFHLAQCCYCCDCDCGDGDCCDCDCGDGDCCDCDCSDGDCCGCDCGDCDCSDCDCGDCDCGGCDCGDC